MLKINDLSKTYREGKKEALKNINLHIREGEFTALLGRNGAGKSTLINIIAGNVKADSGRVTIGGFDLRRDELATKRIIGIVPQEIGFDFVFTVNEVLRNQAGFFGLKNNDAYLDELLKALALSEKKHTRVRDLSGGMKRRLLIAKALIHRPKLLFLDEPTAGVDLTLRHSLYRFLQHLHQTGVTIILTTHYLEEAERLCDRIVVLDDGAIIADAPKDTMIHNQKLEDVYLQLIRSGGSHEDTEAFL